MDYNLKHKMGIHESIRTRAGWMGGWAEGGTLLPRRNQLTDVRGAGGGGWLATHHFINLSKELYSKNHPWIINVRGELDEE